MKFNTLYEIRTRDGQTYKAKLIKLNKYAGKQTLWRREGEVPHKQRYLKPGDIVSAQEI